MATITPGDSDVLIVVDVQNDFMPGGPLAVPDGDAVVDPVNRLGKAFAHVVVTQDWHPARHISFASAHGKAPFETVELAYGTQVLWPDHCLQGSRGAALVDGLALPHAELIIRKGYQPVIDSYSAFLAADQATTTGLGAYLRARGFERVFVCGLATDFCAGFTALDAKREGFAAFMIEDACRGIDQNGSIARFWERTAGAGVERIQASAITG